MNKKMAVIDEGLTKNGSSAIILSTVRNKDRKKSILNQSKKTLGAKHTKGLPHGIPEGNFPSDAVEALTFNEKETLKMKTWKKVREELVDDLWDLCQKEADDEKDFNELGKHELGRFHYARKTFLSDDIIPFVEEYYPLSFEKQEEIYERAFAKKDDADETVGEVEQVGRDGIGLSEGD